MIVFFEIIWPNTFLISKVLLIRLFGKFKFKKELKDKVRKAFEQATSRWKNHLIEMIGESKANIVFSKMEEDIPGTENASPEYNIFNNEIS